MNTCLLSSRASVVLAVVVMVATDAAMAGLKDVHWAPTELSNTVVWLDAVDAGTLWEDTNGTVTATGAVARWDDKSGNTNHAVQGTGSAQPETGVANVNGLNVLEFLDDGLATPLPLTSNFTVFAVAQNDEEMTSPFADNFLGSRQTTAGNEHYSINAKGVGRYDGNNTEVAATTYPAAIPVLVAAWDRVDPSPRCVFRRNGTLAAASGTVRSWDGTYTRWSIGTAYPAPRGDHYLNGKVAEVVIVHSILDADDIEKTEGYLAHKWEMESNLPTNHSYRYSAPGAPIPFGALSSSNITTTTAELYVVAETNLTSATLVWDTSDKGKTNVTDWAGTNSVSGVGSTPGTLSGVATGLTIDTEYVFRFYGEDGTTNGWSTAGTFSTAFSAAQTPSFTMASGSYNGISLQWNDNANTETEYILQRSTNGTSFSLLTTLPADTTNYTDGAVVDRRTYYYRLAATNSVDGSGTDPSACETNGFTALAANMIFAENFEEPVIDGETDIQPPNWVKEPQPADGGALSGTVALNDVALTGKTGDQYLSLTRYNYGLTTKTNAGLTNALQPYVNYTLTCDLLTLNSGDYMYVELRAGTNVLMVTTNVVNGLRTVSMTFLALSGYPHIGETLGIRLYTDYNAYHSGRWKFDNLALYATDTSGDSTAPTPTNMVWISLPTSSVSNSITMHATNAVDVNGVQYFFTNTVNGNVSGWQESQLWSDTGLAPGVTYSYRVKARDKSANTNETNWSSEEAAKCEPHIILYESFETPSLREKGSDSAFGDATWALPPDGWYGSGGDQRLCLDGVSTFPTETPFGEQFAAYRQGYIETTSALSNHVLEAGYTYRITYNTGGAHESTPAGVACENRALLFAGTAVVASNAVTPTLDDFSETNMLEFIPDAGHPNLGDSLTLQLQRGDAASWQYFSIFDNIKVYAIPPPPQGAVLIVR